MAGAAVYSVYRMAGAETAGDVARVTLETAYRTYATLEAERYKRLAMAARGLAEEPEIVDLLVRVSEREAEDETVPNLETEAARTVLVTEGAGFGEGMAAVLDPSGRPLVTTDGLPGTASLSDAETVRQATRRASRQGDSGVWIAGGELHYLAVQPVVRDFEPLGLVATSLPVDDLTGEEVRPPRGQALFLAASPRGVEAVAGTLQGDSVTRVLDRLGPELTEVGGFGRVLEGGDSIDGISVELGEERHAALLAPVRASTEGGSGAAVLFLVPASSGEGLVWESLAILAAAVLLALLLAILLSRWSGRGVRRPLSRLEHAVAAGRRGDFAEAQDLAAGSGAFARLASSLNAWTVELRQEQELRETVVDAVSADEAEVPKPRDEASRDEVVLLGIELREYARSTAAGEAVGRFHRDLSRLRETLRERGGRLVAVSGHRLLAAFHGLDDQDRALAALAAGVEIRRVLTRPTSMFDEPEEREPPTLVLTAGEIVAGSAPLGIGGRLALGLPVQMLETLLREAAPGQILISRDVHRGLAERLEEAGVEPVSQRGILTPQPLYELSPEAAGRVTGVDSPEGEVLTGFRFGSATPGLPEPGEVLGDRFEVREVVGTGPLATVFRAYDREFGRLVAFKAFRREALRDEDRLDRLDSPLGALRSLSHPNVARTYDFGHVANVPFLSRQLVPGLSLRRLVERSGAVSLAAALGAGRQIASGLAAVHEGEMFHGRLKPENVIFETGGAVLVTDFGCVFLAAPGLDLDSSASGYLAPEQEHGEPGDARTDVYVWGLLIYDLATGRIPTLGERIERRGEEADVPPQVQEILSRCLSPEPERRYADGAALLEALTQLAE